MYLGRVVVALSLHIALVSAVHGPDDEIPEDHYAPDEYIKEKQKNAEAAAAATSTSSRPLTFEEQMERGQRLYEEALKRRAKQKNEAQQRTGDGTAVYFGTASEPETTTTTDLPASEDTEAKTEAFTTTKAFAGEGVGFHDPNLKIHDTNNAIKAVPFEVNKKKASKAAEAANNAEKMLSDATQKFEASSKMYEETQAKIIVLKQKLIAQRVALQKKLSQKKETEKSKADRDELDKLNDLVDGLTEKSDANKKSIDAAKKLMVEQMRQADAFYRVAEKSLDVLRKQAEKQYRGRDSDWINAEMERLLKAQEKLEKLRKMAAEHGDLGSIEPLTDAEEPKNLSDKALDQLSSKLELVNSDFQKQLAMYSKEENQLMKAEDKQVELRKKIAQGKIDGKHLKAASPNHAIDKTATQWYADKIAEFEDKEDHVDKDGHVAAIRAFREQLNTNATDDLERERLEKAIDEAEAKHLLTERKAELEDRKNLLKRKKKASEKAIAKAKRKNEEQEKREEQERLAMEAKERERQAAVRSINRRAAQKQRVKINIERGIATEIEAQREKMEKELNRKAHSHHLRAKLTPVHQAEPEMSLPPAIHYDEDVEPAPILVPNDQMPEPSEAQSKALLEDEALERAPYNLPDPSKGKGKGKAKIVAVGKGEALVSVPYDLNDPPKGRSLLEGDAVANPRRTRTSHDL